MANRSRTGENYRNPCLTMHQPWASLLVYGIKRIEGRSWPSPITGRLWIHAAGVVPKPETIKAMEDFYREIYAVDGITDLKFPEHYPTSRLLGCVDVVGCVAGDELACWEDVSEGVRLEALTSFCWLCEAPQKLPIPFEMRGFQGVYNLERKIFEAAVRGLRPVEAPMQVMFPLPDPRDRLSLKPGSISASRQIGAKPNPSQKDKAPNLSAAIAGARAASTQFSKNSNLLKSNPSQNYKAPNLSADMAGARVTSTQFSKNSNLLKSSPSQNYKAPNLSADMAGVRAASTQFSKNSNFDSTPTQSLKKSDRGASVSSWILRNKNEGEKTDGRNLHLH